MLVLFSIFMSVAILFTSFVVDVGNWFEHQRHLQLQADAAAFAAAAQFDYPCTKAIEQAIYQKAGQYGGASTVTAPEGTVAASTTPLYNEQIGGTPQSEIHEEINKQAYYGQPLGNQASETTTVEKAPCAPEASMIDVKLTETNLPWFFKAIDVPYINAHARISIKAEQETSAVEPLIESEPREARVLFVNDEPDGDDGDYEDEVLATALMKEVGANQQRGTVIWSNSAAPAALKVQHPHMGVRIALAGQEGALKGAKEGGSATNETTAVCNHVYVECFDEDDGVIPPLLNISGYSQEGTGTAEKPVVRKVALSNPAPDTCRDGYFSDVETATCTLTVSADVEDGTTNTTGVTVQPEVVAEDDPSYEGSRKEKALSAAMTYEASKGLWVGTVTLPSLTNANWGSSEINLVYTCKKESKSPCTKAEKKETFKDVQRSFAAGPDGSDRIVNAWVAEPSATESPVPRERDADALPICTKTEEKAAAGCPVHNLVVSVELSGSLADARSYSEAPYHIRYGDNDQDHDDQFVVACPPTTNEAEAVTLYSEDLSAGCKGRYRVNTSDPKCTEEKAASEKLTKEEEAQKKAREAEEAARTNRAKEESEATKTREARETKEAKERSKWADEEKETKITKAQRAEKEAAQKTAREKDEQEEATARSKRQKEEGAATVAREKREREEAATKEAREREATAAHDCVALVSAKSSGDFKGVEEKEKAAKEEALKGEELEKMTSLFQRYLTKRIEDPPSGLKYYCPNNWVNDNSGGVPIIPADDSRLIQLFVVPFTVTDFDRESTHLVPIENFATFYVTGWSGDKCASDDKVEKQSEEKVIGEKTREVVGHLIKYVNALGENTGSVGCKLEKFETCEAVLTE